MLQLAARTIINATENEIWELENVPNLSLDFDDTTIMTTGRKTILSWYYWRALAKYDKVPLLSKYHICDRIINKNTLRSMLSNVFDIMDIYGEDIKEVLMTETFDMVNTIYNVFTSRLSRYVRSISAFDLVDVLFHPEVMAANANVEPTEGSIKATKDIIRGVLNKDTSLANNSLSINNRTEMIRSEQILTLVSAVGFREDIDSNIFPKPILKGYAMGMDELPDVMAESRSASKALHYAKAPLQDSEYFNRKLQLICQIVTNLHNDDCGSTQYLEWHVHKSDLKYIAGQYYYSEKGLLPVRENDNHLVGKVIKMRNALYCWHSDRHGVCNKCYGELSKSIPYKTNIGHVAATTVGEQGSQYIMSIKHHDGSSEAFGIELTEADRLFIDGQNNATTFYLSNRRKNKKTKIIISRSEANNLSMITKFPEKIDTLNVFNITQLCNVIFVTEFNGIEDHNIIAMSVGSRKAALSTDMLKYLSTKGWGINAKGDYVIDLDEWDFDKALFELPKKQMGVVEFIGTVKSQLIGSDGSSETKSKKGRLAIKPLYMYKDPEMALRDVYDLINSTLTVNIAHLSVILLAMSVRDPENHDYDIPLPNEPIRFGTYDNIIDRRSLSVKMAYQGQAKAFTDVVSYMERNRPPHLKDEALMRQIY